MFTSHYNCGRFSFLAITITIISGIWLLVGCDRPFSYTGRDETPIMTPDPLPPPGEVEHKQLEASAKANVVDAKQGKKAITRGQAAMPAIATTPGVPVGPVKTVTASLDEAGQRFESIQGRSEQDLVIIPVAKQQAEETADAANQARKDLAQLQSNAWGQKYARWAGGLLLFLMIAGVIASAYFRSERLAVATGACAVGAGAAYAYAMWVAIVAPIIIALGVLAGMGWLAWWLYRKLQQARQEKDRAERAAKAALRMDQTIKWVSQDSEYAKGNSAVAEARDNAKAIAQAHQDPEDTEALMYYKSQIEK